MVSKYCSRCGFEPIQESNFQCPKCGGLAKEREIFEEDGQEIKIDELNPDVPPDLDETEEDDESDETGRGDDGDSEDEDGDDETEE